MGISGTAASKGPGIIAPTQLDGKPIGTSVPFFVRVFIQLVWWIFLMLCLGSFFIPTITFMRWTINEYGAETTMDFVRAFVAMLVGAEVFGVCLVAFTAAVKWIVLGKARPGVYRLWSPYMLRWWMQNNLVMMTNKYVGFFLQDTALYPLYLKIMGAKIGQLCSLDTTKFFDLDLM